MATPLPGASLFCSSHAIGAKRKISFARPPRACLDQEVRLSRMSLLSDEHSHHSECKSGSEKDMKTTNRTNHTNEEARTPRANSCNSCGFVVQTRLGCGRKPLEVSCAFVTEMLSATAQEPALRLSLQAASERNRMSREYVVCTIDTAQRAGVKLSPIRGWIAYFTDRGHPACFGSEGSLVSPDLSTAQQSEAIDEG